MEDIHLLFMYLLLMCILILNDLMNNIKMLKVMLKNVDLVLFMWLECGAQITSDNADLNNNATV